MPLGSTTTRSNPRMAMAMSLVRIRRWWVSQSHPPLMVSRSQFGPRRSCTSMASTFTAPKSFSRMQTLWPCATRYRTYRRRKVVLPAPKKPVIRSTCTIIKKHLLCCCLPGSSIPQQTVIRQWQIQKAPHFCGTFYVRIQPLSDAELYSAMTLRATDAILAGTAAGFARK